MTNHFIRNIPRGLLHKKYVMIHGDHHGMETEERSGKFYVSYEEIKRLGVNYPVFRNALEELSNPPDRRHESVRGVTDRTTLIKVTEIWKRQQVEEAKKSIIQRLGEEILSELLKDEDEDFYLN